MRTPDGRVWRFSGDDATTTRRGLYAWNLSSVSSADGQTDIADLAEKLLLVNPFSSEWIMVELGSAELSIRLWSAIGRWRKIFIPFSRATTW